MSDIVHLCESPRRRCSRDLVDPNMLCLAFRLSDLDEKWAKFIPFRYIENFLASRYLADIPALFSRAGIARRSRLFTIYMGKLVHDSSEWTQNSGLVNFLRKRRLPFAQISQFHLPTIRLGKPETDRFKWV